MAYTITVWLFSLVYLVVATFAVVVTMNLSIDFYMDWRDRKEEKKIIEERLKFYASMGDEK